MFFFFFLHISFWTMAFALQPIHTHTVGKWWLDLLSLKLVGPKLPDKRFSEGNINFSFY